MLERPSDQRTLPVRLCDIRPEVRMLATQEVPTQQRDDDVLAAAWQPSDETYYVSPGAASMLAEILA